MNHVIYYKQFIKETRLNLRLNNTIRTNKVSLNKINSNSLIKEKTLIVYKRYTITSYKIS